MESLMVKSFVQLPQSFQKPCFYFLKGGIAKEASNYRPTSLLPLVSKVLERCVYNRFMDYIAPHLNKLQFGFEGQIHHAPATSSPS